MAMPSYMQLASLTQANINHAGHIYVACRRSNSSDTSTLRTKLCKLSDRNSAVHGNVICDHQVSLFVESRGAYSHSHSQIPPLGVCHTTPAPSDPTDLPFPRESRHQEKSETGFPSCSFCGTLTNTKTSSPWLLPKTVRLRSSVTLSTRASHVTWRQRTGRSLVAFKTLPRQIRCGSITFAFPGPMRVCKSHTSRPPTSQRMARKSDCGEKLA